MRQPDDLAIAGFCSRPPRWTQRPSLRPQYEKALHPPMLATLFLSGCSVFGIRSGKPEPESSVISQMALSKSAIIHRGLRQKRRSKPVPVRLATKESDRRSHRFAAYIFGTNRSNKTFAMMAPVAQSGGDRIAMTAPVTQSRSAQGWVISFCIPRTIRWRPCQLRMIRSFT